MKSRIGAYCRISTFDQVKGRKSQEAALKRYLDAHGLTARWYSDTMTGATVARPDFQKLQKSIFLGEIDTVVVWKLDRLSRSLREGISILTDWIEKGVRIVAVAQQLDFAGPTGRLVASVLFALAELERENLRENTKRGLAAARARGVKLGGRVPGKWTVEVRPLFDAGMRPADIARKLGRSRQAVHNVLNGKTAIYKP